MKKPLRDAERPYGVKDLVAVTGWSEPTVLGALHSGHLPGYQSGPGGKWTCPPAAFHAFCNGTWQPQPREITIRPLTTQPTVLHSVARKQAAS